MEKTLRVEREAFITGGQGGSDQVSNSGNTNLYHELF